MDPRPGSNTVTSWCRAGCGREPVGIEPVSGTRRLALGGARVLGPLHARMPCARTALQLRDRAPARAGRHRCVRLCPRDHGDRRPGRKHGRAARYLEKPGQRACARPRVRPGAGDDRTRGGCGDLRGCADPGWVVEPTREFLDPPSALCLALSGGRAPPRGGAPGSGPAFSVPGPPGGLERRAAGDLLDRAGPGRMGCVGPRGRILRRHRRALRWRVGSRGTAHCQGPERTIRPGLGVDLRFDHAGGQPADHVVLERG